MSVQTAKGVFALLHGLIVFALFLVCAGALWTKAFVWWGNLTFDPLTPTFIKHLGVLMVPAIPAFAVVLLGVWIGCWVTIKVSDSINRELEEVRKS